MTKDNVAAVEAWQRGDEWGVRAIFDAHYPLAVRLAALNGLSTDEAHDCAQDASAHAFERRAQLRDAKAFPLWFHRIVTRHILDALAARKRRAETSLPEQAETAEDWQRNRPARPDELATEAELREELWTRVQELPPNYRVSVVLRYYGNFTTREVAELTGTNEGSVRVTLHRALARLRLLTTEMRDDARTRPATDIPNTLELRIGVSNRGE